MCYTHHLTEAQAVEELAPDPADVITRALIDQAERLREPRVQAVIEPMLAGTIPADLPRAGGIASIGVAATNEVLVSEPWPLNHTAHHRPVVAAGHLIEPIKQEQRPARCAQPAEEVGRQIAIEAGRVNGLRQNSIVDAE